MMRHTHALPIALLLSLATPAFATSPADGIVIGDSVITRILPSMLSVADGAHGIITLAGPWHRATRVDPLIGILWAIDPYAAPEIPTPSLLAPSPRAIATDGAGGFWLACPDIGSNLVTQHLDANGASVGGIATVCSSGSTATWVVAAQSDGAGGVFVVWMDALTSGENDVRASHVDAAGNVTGPPNGVIALGGAGAQAFGGAVSDGVGGLLLLAPDMLGATVQRLDVDLAPAWGAGARIEAPDASGAFVLAASGDGGAFVAWHEGPAAAGHVKLQRLDPSGLVPPSWPSGGALAAAAPSNPSSAYVVADGSGGAFVAWLDSHMEGAYPVQDMRVSRVLGGGSVAAGWPPAEYLGNTSDYPAFPVAPVAADGAGGCYIAWVDQGSPDDVHAMHFLGSGALAPGWPAEGRALGTQQFPRCASPFVLSDGAGGAYVEWLEFRYPVLAHEGLYVLRLTRLVPDVEVLATGPPLRSLALARVSPNPARGRFSVSASLPDDRPAKLELFDLVGRTSLARGLSGAGPHEVTIEGMTLAPGVHWLRLTHPAGVRTAPLVIVR